MKKNRVLILAGISFVIISFIVWKVISSKNSSKVTYQTSFVEKNSLITTVSASGNISSGNNLTISTEATGVIDKVFVKNGDKVKQGQIIATIILDQDAKQKQISAWASYLSTKNNLDSAKDKLISLQSSAFKAEQKFRDQAQSQGLSDQDPTYITQKNDMLTTKNDYQNQLETIKQLEVSLLASSMSYQKLSSNIIAPASGEISNLIIAPGSIISQQSSSNSNSSGTQQVASIKRSNNNLQAKASLTEVDITKVQVGQKVTMTLDAFSDKTFTGKVILVDTNGQISSGVTSYPIIISFDSDPGNIYPNMAVSANIITNIINEALLVPVSAIKTINNQKVVQVLENGNVVNKNVELGQTNGSYTQILSGLSEGESVVTSTTSSKKTTSTSTTSVFSGSNLRVGGMGGAMPR